MSFTWFAPQPLLSREQVAVVVHQVAAARGLLPLASVIALMTISTEVGANDAAGNRQWWCPANPAVADSTGFPHDSLSDDSRSMGYFQQQPGPNGEPWWGTTADMMTLARAANTFLDRLPEDYQRATGSAALAGVYAQTVQQSSFPDRYAVRWDEAWQILNRAITLPPIKETPVPDNTGRIGDPTWLEDVLRPALGDRLRTLPGWKDSGVGGTMGRIWGVIWHHTGNARESAQSIRNGRPDLPGPLAQLHIAPDGTVTIVAVGPCNHAGRGSWPGLPTDNANGVTIGVECAWPSDTSITEATQTRERWPDAQIVAMRDTAAALTKYLGVDASHNISHEEWATKGPAGWRQGKWDPGNLDMDWFRGEITKAMNGEFNPPTTTPEAPVNPPVPNPTYAIPKPATQDSRVGQLWDQLLIRWDMLGGRTPVEALAAIGAELGIDGFQDVTR
ncbi:N-acetylmuramoyl-L-alanine amidase [Mycobacterium sp. CSUR Q5927]|nr:N-acetylmuramoyl-L-alanine amidase [Mycobacterium sp. CSUR Q5927]